MTIVAISRELGSGGNQIGEAVARALGFTFVDREVLLQAASRYAVQEEKLLQVDERKLSFWERFDDEKRRYLVFIEASIFSFAERGNVVLAGRGAPVMLRGVRHALRVRVTAPLEVRVGRVREREEIDLKTAQEQVRAYDREQKARIHYLFGVDWTAPENYDLVLNTERMTTEEAVSLLTHAARSQTYQPTPASLQKIRDLSLAVQVRAALAADPTLASLNIEVGAEAGVVSLRGVVFSEATMEAAAAIARTVPGVREVGVEAVEIPRIYPGPMM